jgi:hypothetical protein
VKRKEPKEVMMRKVEAGRNLETKRDGEAGDASSKAWRG